MRRILVSLLGLLLVAMAWAATQNLNVQVRTGVLRERPTFLGRPIAEVHYGDRVTLIAQEGAWRQVRVAAGSLGWIHATALTEKKLTLASGEDVETGASGDELALASKGFSEEVEAQYRSENPSLAYAEVDRMETLVVTAEEAHSFLKAGELQPEEGGR